jgi:predicted MPP superfamily phosphohydrolase
MKGKISLKEFIGDVKKDLIDSIDNEDPFFTLDSVELEASFALEVDAKGNASFVVVSIGAGSKASQIHKVKLVLTPLDKKPPVYFVTGREIELGGGFEWDDGQENRKGGAKGKPTFEKKESEGGE